MRCVAAMAAGLLAVGLAGCSSPAPAPSRTPIRTTAASADAVFDHPLICREIADYDRVQAAVDSRSVSAVHRAASAAADDIASVIAAERAHTWAPRAAALLPAELDWAAEARAWFRAAASARTIDDVVNREWPDGTTPNTRFWKAIGAPLDPTCP